MGGACNDTRKPEIHTPIWLDSIMRSDIHEVTECGRCFTELGYIYHRVSLITFRSLHSRKASPQQRAFANLTTQPENHHQHFVHRII